MGKTQVRSEIERGAYWFESDVIVDSLPKSKGFINFGKGKLSHNINRFLLEGQYEGSPYSFDKS